MLKQYKKNREELNKAMLSSNENRAKVLEIKKTVRLADKYSFEKITSLMKGGRTAICAALLAAGVFDYSTGWRIAWAIIGAAVVGITISETREKSRNQKSNEKYALNMMNRLLDNNNDEKRSL